MIAVAQVALDGRVAGPLEPLTYLNPSGVVRGQIVLAPLGTRAVFGVVLNAQEVEEVDLPVTLSRMRAVSAPVLGMDLPPVLVDIAEQMAEDTLSPLSMAIGLLFPPGLKGRVMSAWTRTGLSPSEKLTVVQAEVLKAIDDLDGQLIGTKSKPIAAAALRALRQLRQKGYVQEALTIKPHHERDTLPEGLKLTNDEGRVEAFLISEGRKKPAQALTLIRLQGSEGIRLTPQEIKALSGVTDQTLKALLKAKLLDAAPDEAIAPYHAPTLSTQQAKAVQRISDSISSGSQEQFLLFGVTGSGKTEVYLRAAAEALKQGKQVLYLVPEIALTAQVIGQLRGRFGSSVEVIHSNIGQAERLEAWLRVAQTKSPIVMGARSALFAPLNNVGLIVLDEEHEQSYKQESAPRYHAKRVARMLAKRHGATLVLGSATPSLESYWESETGVLQRLEMPERAAAAKLPTVHIVDLAEQYQSKEARPSMFSHSLHERLEMVLKRKEQAILFLNRRAYSPFLSCRECGHIFRCHQCAVSLSYHKRDNSLVCHYCGERQRVPEFCPNCDGDRLSPTGAGSEKVEEALRSEFPMARVARLDRDVVRKKGALEETFALMRAGELDFLAGTQMVAKGLDFPGVTLVGVIVADTALHLPDFRASERTFQLLSQVSGRAGRAQKPGEVVIQTFSPKHPAVLCAQNHDYVQFYESVLLEREQVGYPPFTRLINIVLSGENRTELIQFSKVVAERIVSHLPIADILGPVDCNLERLNGLWRRHILLKVPLDTSLAPLAKLEIEHQKVSVVIDVDPYTMI
ncbi:MAG: primosomal protein N' [Chthonomonas sp.]|nr:primosomal protein N' [Chthonomonas sp.]